MFGASPKKLRAGDEITSDWLNRLVDWCAYNEIRLGDGCGLAAQQSKFTGTHLSVINTPTGVFFCQPSSSVSGASGTWPSLTPVSFTADVYQMRNGVLTLVQASATVWNGYPASLAASKVCTVLPDGSGDWVVIAQSCT